MGQAVHTATAADLNVQFPGRFEYSRIGPDFLHLPTGQLIELTTPGQVASHVAKGGEYATASYATYNLP